MNNDMSVLRELQIVELKILKEVVRICEKHSLEYFAIDGTLLGAVRHGGFIPWDDDVDIGLPRDSFERFVELAPKELPSSMSIILNIMKMMTKSYHMALGFTVMI